MDQKKTCTKCGGKLSRQQISSYGRNARHQEKRGHPPRRGPFCSSTCNSREISDRCMAEWEAAKDKAVAVGLRT